MTSRLLLRWFLVFLFLCPCGVYAACADTTLTRAVSFIFPETLLQHKVSSHLPDTSLSGFQQYNPGLCGLQIPIVASAGNTGAAQKPLYVNFSRDVFISGGTSPFDKFFFTPAAIRFYDARKQYTDVQYVLGAKKEQVFSITHTQNISPWWNAGIDYRKISSEGFFKHQATSVNNLDVFSWYHSRNNRYNLLATAIFNRIANAENGGIASDSVYEDPTRKDDQLVPVSLSQAENRWKEKRAFIQQSWDAGCRKSRNENDSAKTFVPGSRFFLILDYDKQTRIYEDLLPPVSYYRTMYYDSSHTYDSLFFLTTSARAGWFRIASPANAHTLTYGLSLSYQHSTWRQQSFDSTYESMGTSVHAGSADTSKAGWHAAGDYVFYGSAAGNYHVALAMFMPVAHARVGLLVDAAQTSPSIQSTSWLSNNYQWYNSFLPLTQQRFRITFDNARSLLHAAVSYHTLGKYIYYDTIQLPVQYSGSVHITSVSFSKEFRIGHTGIQVSALYQYADTVLRLPHTMVYTSFFYENDMFRKAMRARAGVDFRYFSAYRADGYMPATGVFYQQNEKSVGGYPAVDVFVNLSVRRVRFFVKSEHVNQGLLPGKFYYTIPRYPMPGRAFKLGINWRFYD